MASVLMSAFVLASCSDDNNNVAPKDGNPQMEVAAITAAQFGDSLTVNVTCTDTKVPLSTLKAVLKYGEESVQHIRCVFICPSVRMCPMATHNYI